MKYQRNNILFRIASSDAISRFKRDQAASFMQLTRKELNFDKSAREGVLLEFDRFSQMIFRLEKICCAVGEGEMSAHLRTTMIESILDELTTIETIMLKHEEVFSDTSLEFAKLIHKYSVDLLLSQIEKASDGPIDMVFSKVVEIISMYLQHILLAYHEYNTNIINSSDKPFINISAFNINERIKSFVPEQSRITYFSKYNCGTAFTLKNYTDENIFSDVVEHFKALNVTITPEDEYAEISHLG